MLPGLELMGCTGLAVPGEVMRHVVHVESSSNPYAIGVVGGRLVRQPKSLAEALATVRMLEQRGFNFSVGLAQVNRHNLGKYSLDSYEKAFQSCANLQAGSRILAECYGRSGRDWGKAFSCYYSGNFVTGYRHGYVQKVAASMRRAAESAGTQPISVVDLRVAGRKQRIPASRVAAGAAGMAVDGAMATLLQRRIRSLQESAQPVARAQPITSQPMPVAALQPSASVQAPATVALRDAPVTVQPYGTPLAAPGQGNTIQAATGKPQPVTDRRDDAFVF